MAMTTGTGTLSRFLRFTTQKEPILSSATLVAIALAIITRFVPLTDDDLQLLALLLLPFAPAVLARLKAWSPASVERTREAYYERGRAAAIADTIQKPLATSRRSAMADVDGDGR